MVEYDKVLSLEFYNYKGIFSGSLLGMRYRIEKKKAEEGEEEKEYFLVHAWKEPYNFDVTPKEEMDEKSFAFTNEGKQELVDWLNDIFEEKYSKK